MAARKKLKGSKKPHKIKGKNWSWELFPNLLKNLFTKFAWSQKSAFSKITFVLKIKIDLILNTKTFLNLTLSEYEIGKT